MDRRISAKMIGELLFSILRGIEQLIASIRDQSSRTSPGFAKTVFFFHVSRLNGKFNHLILLQQHKNIY